MATPLSPLPSQASASPPLASTQVSSLFPQALRGPADAATRFTRRTYGAYSLKLTVLGWPSPCAPALQRWQSWRTKKRVREAPVAAIQLEARQLAAVHSEVGTVSRPAQAGAAARRPLPFTSHGSISTFFCLLGLLRYLLSSREQGGDPTKDPFPASRMPGTLRAFARTTWTTCFV